MVAAVHLIPLLIRYPFLGALAFNLIMCYTVSEWRSIMPKLNDAMSGIDIGKGSRQYYIWVQCPLCHLYRWRPKFDAKRDRRPNSYLHLCHHCAVSQRGDKSPAWKGGKVKDGEGYILIYVYPDDFFAPMRNNMGYVREHRLVIAKSLGRCLHVWEMVHHKNGARNDNRISNLQLLGNDRHNQITLLERRITYLEGLVLSLGGSP